MGIRKYISLQLFLCVSTYSINTFAVQCLRTGYQSFAFLDFALSFHESACYEYSIALDDRVLISENQKLECSGNFSLNKCIFTQKRENFHEK